MQFLIAFTCGLVCLLAVSEAAPPTEEQVKHKQEILKKCIAETGINPEVLHKIRKGEDVTDEKLPCFGACMMQNFGIMTEEGVLKKEAAIAHIPEGISKDEANKLIEACGDEKGDDPCTSAALILKCLHEHKAANLWQHD